jgi:CrcB protein
MPFTPTASSAVRDRFETRSQRNGARGLDRIDDCDWRNAMAYLIVFLGGGIGAALRHGINLAAVQLAGRSFPYGTMFINVTGSLVMGLIAEYFALKSNLPRTWLLFLTTGILGGYTTFSAFSLETALLYERGEIWAAGLYVLGSVVLAITGLFVGLAIVRAVI